MKRLFVLCDGTWETALYQTDERSLTNIARIANAILPQDHRTNPPTTQLKLYLPGLGTGEELLVGAMKGAYGDGLLEELRLAYYFLAQNWEPGDEIYLFGFSRGAYTVRLLSSLLGLIGILSPRDDLHLFPKVLNALCSRREGTSAKARRNELELDTLLRRINRSRTDSTRDSFFVAAMCLFDTVPLLHHFEISPFGLSNTKLEPDTCKLVLQALSAYEDRPAYRPLVLEQDPSGARRGQILRQVWFPGCHTDIGGGYPQHDLSDLTLHWFVGQLSDGIAIDLDYIAGISHEPSGPWGMADPHVGVRLLQSGQHPRALPLSHNRSSAPTFELLHPSLSKQASPCWPKRLRSILPILATSYQTRGDNGGWWRLSSWEKTRKTNWRQAVKQRVAMQESYRVTTSQQVVLHQPATRHRSQSMTSPSGLRAFVAHERAKIVGAGDASGLAHAR
ncbi:hypothetical protein JCM10908_001906 [Rhodotorula pacifica]|uniref:T6SS phospholipase effector Tle1-like catalytic domain-containing protein n=1 Tax=Rhodotorula pacifica TaxID=1495444 RepID=UPI003178395D